MHIVCPSQWVFRGYTIISNVVYVTHSWFPNFIEFWSPSWILAAMLIVEILWSRNYSSWKEYVFKQLKLIMLHYYLDQFDMSWDISLLTGRNLEFFAVLIKNYICLNGFENSVMLSNFLTFASDVYFIKSPEQNNEIWMGWPYFLLITYHFAPFWNCKFDHNSYQI